MAAVGSGLAILVSGCANLTPPPYETPSAQPVVTPTDASPDGFSAAERGALRVWSPTCDAYRNGSAWMLDATRAITNRHVVEGAETVRLTDYQGTSYTVTDVHMSADDDLAILTISDEFPHAATLAEAGPEVGDPVSMSGFTAGGPLETLSGPYIETRENGLDPEGANVYFVGIPAREGDSGSALVDVSGDVVGVIYAADGGDYAGAVTVDRVRAFLSSADSWEPVTADC